VTDLDSPAQRPTDLDLERFLTDDLDDDARARVARAIDADADLAAHVAARRAEQRAFFVLHPRAPAAARLPAWPLSLLSLSSLRQALAPLAACAAVLVLFVSLDGAAPQTRMRGDALSARLLVRRGAGDDAVVFALAGQPLRLGDAVRIEVDLSAAGHCSVIGIDNHGTRTLHYDRVAVLAGTQVLADALVLDGSSGVEDWVVVCGDDVDVAGFATAVVGAAEPEVVARRFPQAMMTVLSFTKEVAPE